MAIITKSQYEAYISSKLGVPYLLPNNLEFNFNNYLSLYTRQLLMSGIISDNTVIEETYDLECGKKYIPIPVFQDNVNFKVERVNIPTNTKTLLVKDIDYRVKKKNVMQAVYNTVLDLTCLSCSCECDYFIVTGNKGFKLDQDFLNIIMNIIYNNLTSSGSLGTTIGGSDCCANIQSKSIGGLTVNYKTTATANSAKIIKNSEFILSYPVIMQMIQSLQYYYIQY